MKDNIRKLHNNIDVMFKLIKDRAYRIDDLIIMQAIDILEDMVDEMRRAYINDKYDTDYNSTKDCAEAMYNKREELKSFEQDIENCIGKTIKDVCKE